MDFAGVRQARVTNVFQGIAASVIATNKTFSVTVNGTTVLARASRDLTVAIGDIVLCTRINNQVLAFSRLFQAAPAAPDTEQTSPPPKPQPDVVTGSTVLAASFTGSYRNTGYVGWRTDNDSVYQGEYGSNGRHVGVALYGNSPRSLAGVEVLSASIRAKRLQGGDFAKRQTTLRMVTNKTKPSGAPTFYTATDANGPNLAVNTSDTTIAIPAAFAQALVDGNAGGLAIYVAGGSPYVKLAGRSDWSQAFTLTIKWKRET
jgi:hypothetical protein